MATVVEGQALPASSRTGVWLFSAPVDLSVFLGSAVVSLLALWVGAYLGLLHSDTPNWAWVPAILLIDVAHVYATFFRVYFDLEELKRRVWLYTSVPVCGFMILAALYSEGELLFWRVLAYLAIFHFVRQQYGWVALYRAKAGEHRRLERMIDDAAIYSATLYPLVYWHAHLPRHFWWFLEHDLQPIPLLIADILQPIYWLTMLAYAIKSIANWKKGRANPGKDIVLVTTAVCWHVGIITFNSDYAFTVTNVVIHGVPYIALIYWYMRSGSRQGDKPKQNRLRTVVVLLGTIWLLAYVEELLWHRTILDVPERTRLFGGSIDVGSLDLLLVPLLALPQMTHYILDGFIWRRKSNPNFSLIRNNE